jgi:aryl-alcohol dehydrogenase-like predicted oxidoreductase
LTGKYNSGDLPADSRFSSGEGTPMKKFFCAEKREDTLQKLNALDDLAKELGVS